MNPIKILRKFTTYLREVGVELKKASWPWDSNPKAKGVKKYRELIDSTIVILIATILLGAFVATWDIILNRAYQFLTTQIF